MKKLLLIRPLIGLIFLLGGSLAGLPGGSGWAAEVTLTSPDSIFDVFMQDVWNGGQQGNRTYNYGGRNDMWLGVYDGSDCDGTDTNYAKIIIGIDTAYFHDHVPKTAALDSARFYAYCYNSNYRSGCDYDTLKTCACAIRKDFWEGTANVSAQDSAVCCQSRHYNKGGGDWAKNAADSVGGANADRLPACDDTTVIGGAACQHTWVSWDIDSLLSLARDSADTWGMNKIAFLITYPGLDSTGMYYLRTTEYSYSDSFPYIKVWYTEELAEAPDSLMTTTRSSEQFAPNGYGYGSPDSTNLVDWTPELTFRTNDDSTFSFHVQVVSDTTDTTSKFWSVIDTLDNVVDSLSRSEKIEYAGKILRDGYWFYWRVRTFGAGAAASEWSEWRKFMGVAPDTWWDSLYTNRANIWFPGSHSLLSAGYTAELEFRSGNNHTIFNNANFNSGVNGSGEIVYLQATSGVNYSYTTGLIEDTLGNLNTYIIKLNMTGDHWYDPVLVGTPGDIHGYLNLIVGEDDKLHIIINAHYSQCVYIVSDSANGDSGININYLDTLSNPTGADKMTYGRLIKTSNGHLFMFFRKKGVTNPAIDYDNKNGYYCYIRNKWNGSSYDGWSARRYLIYYKDDVSGAHDFSIYNGGCAVDDNDRVYLLIDWHDFYQDKNKTRGLSVVYSDLNEDSVQYFHWFEYETTDTVGHTTTSCDSTKNIYYGAVSKVIESHYPDSCWAPCPFTNSPTLIPDTLYPMISFHIDHYYDPAGGGRTKAPVVFGKLNSNRDGWVLDNLACETKFRAVDTGDKDTFMVTIEEGTAEGVKVLCSAGDRLYYTYGVTDSSSNTKVFIPGVARGCVMPCDSGGIADSVKVLVRNRNGGSGSTIRAAIYRDADSSFVDSTAVSGSIDGATPQWVKLHFLNSQTLKKDTSYLVVFNQVSGSDTVDTYRRNVVGYTYWTNNSFSGAFPAKFVPDDKDVYKLIVYELVVYNRVFTDTFDNISTPSALRDSVNTLDYMEIEYVGIALPDTFSTANMDSGGTGRHSYLLATATDDMAQYSINYTHGGAMIRDGSDIYVYSNVVSDSSEGDWRAQNTYEWKCANAYGSASSARWSGRYLTKNTGWGAGRITVVPEVSGNLPKQILSCRGKDIDYLSISPYFQTQIDGDDIRIVMSEFDSTEQSVTHYELHRVPDMFGLDTTRIWFKIPTGVSIPADSMSGCNVVFSVYWRNPYAENPKANPDSVFGYYESFEDANTGDTLNGYDGWTSSSSLSKICAFYDINSLSSAIYLKLYAGDKFVYGVGEMKREMGTNLTNKEFNIKVYTFAGSGNNIYIKLQNDNDWVGIGYNTTDEIVREGDTITGWSNDIHEIEEGRMLDFQLIVDADGVDGYVNGLTAFTNNNKITAFDSLEIIAQGRRRRYLLMMED
jgi:hypothetical protein